MSRLFPLTGFSTNGLVSFLLSTTIVLPSSISSTSGGQIEPPVPPRSPKDTPVLFFSDSANSVVSISGPPSRLTSTCWGVGTSSLSRMARQRRRSQRAYYIGKSLTQKGLRSCTYRMALASGKSCEKKDTRKSHTGQSSTSSSKITLSPNIVTSKWYSRSLPKIALADMLLALGSKAQMPMICLTFLNFPASLAAELKLATLLCRQKPCIGAVDSHFLPSKSF